MYFRGIHLGRHTDSNTGQWFIGLPNFAQTLLMRFVQAHTEHLVNARLVACVFMGDRM